MSRFKLGDLVSYEPLPQWEEAQEMWGAVGVVKELIPNYEFDGTLEDCLRLNWLHTPKSEKWCNMIISEENCKKIGEVLDGV